MLNVMDGRADYHSFMRRWNIALKKIGTQEVVPDKVGKKRKIIYRPLFPDGMPVPGGRYRDCCPAP